MPDANAYLSRDLSVIRRRGRLGVGLLGLLGCLIASTAWAQTTPVTGPAHVIVDSCTGCGGSVTLPTITFGQTAGTSGLMIAATDGTNAQPLKVDGSDYLYVDCPTCSGSGASLGDGGSMVVGTTAFAPAGGVYFSAKPTALATAKGGWFAMSAYRSLFVSAMDSAGNDATDTTNHAFNVTLVSPATLPVSGTFWQATQPVSGTFWQATQPVSGSVTATQGTASNLNATVVGTGTFATQSAVTAASGAIASGAIAAGAYAAGSYAVGAIPPAAGVLVSGVTAAMTGTTSTVVVAAAASNTLYITSCAFSNTHASVTTMMTLQDGSGGTALWTGIVPFGGGSNITFPVPLKVPTSGNGLYVANVTTGSNTFASCSGFRSTVSY